MIKSKTPSNRIFPRKKKRWFDTPAGKNGLYVWWIVDPSRIYVSSAGEIHYLFELKKTAMRPLDHNLSLSRVESFYRDTFCLSSLIYTTQMFLNDRFAKSVPKMFVALLESEFDIENPVELLTLGGQYMDKPTYFHHVKDRIM